MRTASPRGIRASGSPVHDRRSVFSWIPPTDAEYLEILRGLADGWRAKLEM
jgi:hypothetical protein